MNRNTGSSQRGSGTSFPSDGGGWEFGGSSMMIGGGDASGYGECVWRWGGERERESTCVCVCEEWKCGGGGGKIETGC